MIRFEEIDKRLESLGKDRVWLSAETSRSEGAIRAALAPKSIAKNRSKLLQKALSDAIEREEARVAALKNHPPFERQQLVLRPSDAEFSEWCKAAAGKPVHEWAGEALNRSAARYRATLGELPRGPVVVPDQEAEKEA